MDGAADRPGHGAVPADGRRGLRGGRGVGGILRIQYPVGSYL